MSVDTAKEKYQCDDIFSPYSKTDLPFQFDDGETIPNSEKELKCWYIENPINKELVKHMTLRFGPKVEKEFVIVMKAPNNRVSYNLASFITIKLANLRR